MNTKHLYRVLFINRHESHFIIAAGNRRINLIVTATTVDLSAAVQLSIRAK